MEKTIPHATTSTHINQYKTDKQNLIDQIGDVDKYQIQDTRYKIPNTRRLVTKTVLNTKISEVENKIPNTGSLVTTTVLNTKINEVENKIIDHAKYITTQEFNKLRAENFEARLK